MIARFLEYWGGWRVSTVLAVMLFVLAAAWFLQGREWPLPLVASYGWALLARMEWKRDGGEARR